MATPPPIPSCVTTRKFGVELEVDPVGQSTELPASVAGWEIKSDGSLSALGREFIFSEPASWDAAVVRVQTLSKELQSRKLNLKQVGALHVHVSASDFNAVNGAAVVNLYRHFQPAINRLVGMSRHDNMYCRPYDEPVTADDVTALFDLNTSKTRAQLSTQGGRRKVVNLAPLAVAENQRSIEFRQCSSSTRAICILGWMAFVAFLVDTMATSDSSVDLSDYESNFKGLLEFVKDNTGGRGSDKSLIKWLEWRRDYLVKVDDGSEEKIILGSRFQAIGLYTAARLIDSSVPAARLELERLVSQNKMVRVGSRYRSAYRLWAKHDLEALRQHEVQPAIAATS